ncbi:MAG: FAD-dependent oxidoreductase [Pseudomonadales bacterium]
MAEVDVIVVGGGGAGMSAAITASDSGASVLLVEADRTLGGSTALSGGVYYAAGTRVQQQLGITGDTADAMFEYYLTLNQYRVDPALVRVLCDQAAEGLHWLMAMGVDFPAAGLYASGVESVPRGHGAAGNGAAIAAALDREVSRRPIDVALGTRVDGLLTDAGGRITGIRAGADSIAARTVVLTTGGFGASPALRQRLYPQSTVHGDAAWYIGKPQCVGDGITLGERAGADIVGHDRGLLLTTPNFRKVLEVFVPGWLVYVNREGQRFVRETAEYAVMAGVVQAQTGGTCFAIFDEASRRDARPLPRYADAFASGALPLNWVADELAHQAGAGKVVSAASLDALAGRIGLRPGALEVTVAEYNADVASGSDKRFFKAADDLRPIAEPPFHAVEILPAIVCLTSAGIRIDADARALDTRGLPIAGLYAAGETCGNVLGERYIGGGNSIANAIVFGRVAGSTAARECHRV